MDKKKQNQEKFIRLYETSKKCLILTDIVYNKIEKDLFNLESENTETNIEQYTCDLYLNIFSFIDFTHRFLQIIDSMPLLSKKRPEVTKLNNTLNTVKECRNYLQHMKEHLCKDELIDYPILGAFSWISENTNYIILPTQFTKYHSSVGIEYDTIEIKYTCKYQFCVGSHEIKIDKVYEAIKEFWNWFESVSQIEPKEIKKYEWGNPNIIYSTITYS